jgi:predicted methyltransferase
MTSIATISPHKSAHRVLQYLLALKHRPVQLSELQDGPLKLISQRRRAEVIGTLCREGWIEIDHTSIEITLSGAALCRKLDGPVESSSTPGAVQGSRIDRVYTAYATGLPLALRPDAMDFAKHPSRVGDQLRPYCHGSWTR